MARVIPDRLVVSDGDLVFDIISYGHDCHDPKMVITVRDDNILESLFEALKESRYSDENNKVSDFVYWGMEALDKKKEYDKEYLASYGA